MSERVPKRRLAAIAAAWLALAAGCDADPNVVPRDPDAAPANESAAEPVRKAASAKKPGVDASSGSAAASRYTSLAQADCRRISVDHEAGGWTAACPGLGGYGLLVYEGDARMAIDVVAPDGTKQSLELSRLVSSAFSSLGPRAEWRFASGAEAPGALIVRFDAYEYPEQPERRNSYLVVARLAGPNSCVIARIGPGPDQNRRARQIADRAADAACLKSHGT